MDDNTAMFTRKNTPQNGECLGISEIFSLGSLLSQVMTVKDPGAVITK